MAGNNHDSDDSQPETTYDEVEASLGPRKRKRKPTPPTRRRGLCNRIEDVRRSSHFCF